MLFADCVSINDYWLTLYSLLQVLIWDYVPVSSFHRHFSRRKLPIPRHIRTAILRKRKAWKRWKRDQTVNNKLLYDAASAECSKSIGGWSYRNGLPLNMEKCVCLHYGNKNQRLNYVIKDQPVQNADSSAELGVTRTCDFRNNDHVNKICLTVSHLAGMVFKLFSSKDFRFLTQVFITYVRLLTEYASVIRNPADVGSCVQLERIQRRFTRRMFGRNPPAYEERLCTLGMPTLQLRRRALDYIFTYKLLHSLVDVDAKAIGLQMLSLNTRGNGVNLCVRHAKSNCIKRSFSYRIPKDWNELPIDIKSAKSLAVFKNKLWFYLLK